MTEPDGLLYMRARHYNPDVGRFISDDPISFDARGLLKIEDDMSKSFYRLLLLLGGGCILVGLTILLIGGSQRYGGPEFLGWERVTYGLPNIILGCIFFYLSIKKLGLKFNSEIETVVCPNCGSAFEKKTESDQLCNKCGVSLEPLENFYNRHPEFKKD